MEKFYTAYDAVEWANNNLDINKVITITYYSNNGKWCLFYKD